MTDQRSRLFHRMHPPHNEKGHFVKGAKLVTRWDGVTRWMLHFIPHTITTSVPRDGRSVTELRAALDDDKSLRWQMFWLSEQGYRVMRDLIVIIVAALLVFFVGQS